MCRPREVLLHCLLKIISIAYTWKDWICNSYCAVLILSNYLSWSDEDYARQRIYVVFIMDYLTLWSKTCKCEGYYIGLDILQFRAVAACSILQITEHLSRPNLSVLSSGTNIPIRSLLLSSAIWIFLIFLGHCFSNCPQSWRCGIWEKDSLQSFLGPPFQVTRATYEKTDNWAVDDMTVWILQPKN